MLLIIFGVVLLFALLEKTIAAGWHTMDNAGIVNNMYCEHKSVVQNFYPWKPKRFELLCLHTMHIYEFCKKCLDKDFGNIEFKDFNPTKDGATYCNNCNELAGTLKEDPGFLFKDRLFNKVSFFHRSCFKDMCSKNFLDNIPWKPISP